MAPTKRPPGRAVDGGSPVKKKAARKAKKKPGRKVGGWPPVRPAKNREGRVVGGWAKGGQRAKKAPAKPAARKRVAKRRGRR